MFKIDNLQYEAPGLGDTDEVNPRAQMELAIAKFTGELLEREYPGWAWGVRVEMTPSGGLIMLSLPNLMGPKDHYVIQVNDALHDPTGKLIKNGAGEILERYGLRRGAFSQTEWRQALIGGVNLDPLR